MWQQIADQNRKSKTSVNEIVVRHSPKISPISKPDGCVKNNIGERKLNTKELSGYCLRSPVQNKNITISHTGIK